MQTEHLYEGLSDYYHDLDRSFEDEDLKDQLEQMQSDMYYEDILDICTKIVELYKDIKDYE